MRRNRAELRLLVRAGFFLGVAADFRWGLAAWDCGVVLELVLEEA